jgi:hypothetical protein
MSSIDLIVNLALANRWPNRAGRRLKINSLLSNLNELAVTDLQDAGDLGESLITMGIWANLDAKSITTLGKLADLDLFENFVSNGIILTSHAPLTKGYGDAQIADLEDVQVSVNGIPEDVVAMDPVLGILILSSTIAPNSTVEVSYHYTPNPTVELSRLNSPAFRLNQWQDKVVMPFEYNTVLAPYQRPQPVQYEYRYRAFDYPYTSVLNDPTSMLLNEPRNRLTLPKFTKENNAFSVFFEGSDHPVDFEYVGEEPLGPAEFEDGLYVIDNMTMSQTVIDGFPKFFQKDIDTDFPHTSILNFRAQITDVTSTGVFTGIAAGYANTNSLYLTAFLDVDGFKTLGVLADKDETELQSYRGLSANADDDVLTFSSQPAIFVGTRILIDGDTYMVTDVEDTGTQWDITLDAPVPTSGSVEVFVESDWEILQTYRVFKTATTVQVFAGGSVLPVISVTDLAVAPDIFGIVDTNSLFFGSLNRQEPTRSLWGFVRFSALPDFALQQSSNIERSYGFDVLPEDSDPPWYLTDNQGWHRTLNADFLLTQSVGQYFDGGGVTFTRLEPFLTARSILEATARLRVHSYAAGTPAMFTVVDDKKEVTLAFFDESSEFVSVGSESLITKGFWAGANSTSLQSRGHLTGFSEIPEDQYVAAFGGVRLFENSGWVSTIPPSEYVFYDQYARISHDGSSTYTAFYEDVGATFTNYVITNRIRFEEWQTTNDRLPVLWGNDDTERQVYLAPFDDGSQRYMGFVDESGNPVLDGMGDPITVSFEWEPDTFHQYKVIRNGDNIIVFVDGVYQGTFDISDLPASTNSDPRTVFSLLGDSILLSMDYLFSHSVRPRNRKVGVYRGQGSFLDPDSYDFIDDVEWLGTFLDIRLRRNPTGKTQIWLNDDLTFDYQYSELPDRQDRYNINAESGYVYFGSPDPNSYAEVLWDEIEYRIINQRDDQKANNNSIINRHNVIASPESVIDETPETVTLQVINPQVLDLSQVGMYADRVLAVLSPDGMTTYPFSYDFSTNLIHVVGGISDPEVVVVFYHRAPFTEAYLENNWAFTRLNETTPPVPLRQQVNLTSTIVTEGNPSKAAESLMTKGFWGGGNGASLNTVGHLTGVPQPAGTFSIVYEKNDWAWYESLKILPRKDNGKYDLLSPACDHGPLSLLFEEPFDQDVYSIPEQGDEYTGHNFKTAYFNHEPSVFNHPEAIFAGLVFPVSKVLDQTINVAYAGAEDDEPEGEIEDFYGTSLFNNPKTTLNVVVNTPGDVVHEDSVVATANTITSVTLPLDFT